MAEDNKQKQRAEEIDRAVREHDARKKDDSNVDLGTERGSGSSGEHLDKFLTAMDAMSKKLDDAFERMDALEKHHKDDAKKRDDARRQRDDDHKRDDETEEEYEERCRREGRDPTEAREVVADSAHRGEFADVQERAEKAYLSWGMRANAPLAGERLRAYRLRLLRPLQKHSKQYSKSDLETIRDKAIFDAVEQSVYADSISASSSPDSVEPGRLRMVTKKLASGHTINEFVGSPNSWMDRFAPPSRRYVVRVNHKWSGNPTE